MARFANLLALTLMLGPAPLLAQPAGAPAGRWFGYPVEMATPNGIYLYGTEGFLGGHYDNPYQDILGIGERTINPVVHRSPNCNSVDNFCGDEVAFGTNDLGKDVTGRDNSAFGDDALPNLTSGNNDTCMGSSACANVTTANFLTGYGVSACQNISQTSGPVTCLGASAMQQARIDSKYAVGVGFQAFFGADTVQFSTGLGDAAGYKAASVIDSVLLGFGACDNSASLANVICVGRESGPASRGPLANTLWIGGRTPILFGDLARGAVGVHTASLAPGATLTVPGVVAATALQAIGSPPTASGSCAISDQLGGAAAGSFRAAGLCAAGTLTLTLGVTAANGWACVAQDMTTPADSLKETAYSPDSVTFLATLAGADQAVFSCQAC